MRPGVACRFGVWGWKSGLEGGETELQSRILGLAFGIFCV